MGKRHRAAPRVLDRQRNTLHDHPMLRKGGVHEKTNKAKRNKEKMCLRREMKESFSVGI